MPLLPGDPAPCFIAATRTNPNFGLDTAAGRYLLIALVPQSRASFLDEVDHVIAAARSRFDDNNLAFFGVLGDLAVWSARSDNVPGIRWFADGDGAVSRAFGVGADTDWSGWILIDPNFRVLLTLAAEHTGELPGILSTLPPVTAHAGVELFAPVLIVPRIFEPSLCEALIEAYQAGGGRPSGVMQDVEGRTLGVLDDRFKSRRDYFLAAGPLRDAARTRIHRRLAPQIAKAFQFQVTRMERDLVACYDADEGGFFAGHRDNTTRGTAHRRFAVTINLNDAAYVGGDLCFPEYGERTYRPPTGGAIVFSCSLLHEALPVRSGKRYAFLPFLYDEAAAAEREQNARWVGSGGSNYKAGPNEPPSA